MDNTFIIAEMSANHCGDLQLAKKIIVSAKECGADAIKLQTYTADTMTVDCKTAFVSNVFFDVSETIDLKIQALAEYKSELMSYPHPRSLEHIKNLAKTNGAKVGIEYGEAFVLLRRIAQ